MIERETERERGRNLFSTFSQNKLGQLTNAYYVSQQKHRLNQILAAFQITSVEINMSKYTFPKFRI